MMINVFLLHQIVIKLAKHVPKIPMMKIINIVYLVKKTLIYMELIVKKIVQRDIKQKIENVKNVLMIIVLRFQLIHAIVQNAKIIITRILQAYAINAIRFVNNVKMNQIIAQNAMIAISFLIIHVKIALQIAK